MMTFWSSRYTKKQIVAMQEAISHARQYLIIKENCGPTSECIGCECKGPCEDLMRLHQHLLTLTEDN